MVTIYPGNNSSLHTRSVFFAKQKEIVHLEDRIEENELKKKEKKETKNQIFFHRGWRWRGEEEGLLRGKSVARSAANPASAKRYRIFASFCGSGKKGGKICAGSRKKKKKKKEKKLER